MVKTIFNKYEKIKAFRFLKAFIFLEKLDLHVLLNCKRIKVPFQIG